MIMANNFLFAFINNHGSIYSLRYGYIDDVSYSRSRPFRRPRTVVIATLTGGFEFQRGNSHNSIVTTMYICKVSSSTLTYFYGVYYGPSTYLNLK